MDEPQLVKFKDWTFRLRPAQTGTGTLLVLIHGWMGDENSMWVLAHKLSPKFSILSPRAPFPVTEGGYSWREIKPGTFGMFSLEDLRPAVDALLAFIDDWSVLTRLKAEQFDLMGFSQGAVMTYGLAFLYPQRVRRLAALSGFIPEDGEAYITPQRLSGKPIFVAHGRQDKLISVDRARRSVALLSEVNAEVTYCESDTGHKVSKECMKLMKEFMEQD